MARTLKGKLNEFGPRLAQLREEMGLTQAQVAERLQLMRPVPWDCSVIVYCTIERQQRSMTDIELLAILKVMGKTIKDL